MQTGGIDVEGVLARAGAVISGSHFVYTSGKHGAVYINKDALFMNPVHASALGFAIACEFEESGIEVVLAPAVGAITLGQWVAYHLSKLTESTVLSVFADKSGDGFVIKRGYASALAGKRTLAVDDILTTGGSAREVVETGRAVGALVIGLAAVVNRGGVTSQMVGDVEKFFCLTNTTLAMYEPDECPFCKTGVPINTRLGHGKAFLAERASREAM